MARAKPAQVLEIPASAYKKLFDLVQWEITTPKGLFIPDSLDDSIVSMREEIWEKVKGPGHPLYSNIHRGTLYVEAEIDFDTEEGQTQLFKVLPKQRKRNG